MWLHGYTSCLPHFPAFWPSLPAAACWFTLVCFPTTGLSYKKNVYVFLPWVAVFTKKGDSDKLQESPPFSFFLNGTFAIYRRSLCLCVCSWVCQWGCGACGSNAAASGLHVGEVVSSKVQWGLCQLVLFLEKGASSPPVPFVQPHSIFFSPLQEPLQAPLNSRWAAAGSRRRLWSRTLYFRLPHDFCFSYKMTLEMNEVIFIKNKGSFLFWEMRWCH